VKRYSVEQLVNANRRSQTDRVVTELFGQIEEIHNAGYMDAIAHGGAEDQMAFHLIASWLKLRDQLQ
jgi:hypothetical protein